MYHFNPVDLQTERSPLFTFPNNQQEIPIRTKKSRPYHLTQLIYSRVHGLILLGSDLKDEWEINLIIPNSQPGHYSALPETNITRIVTYETRSCIPGTSRNISSFGPCYICPPGTTNNGSKIDCEQCSPNEPFCVRSLVNSIHKQSILSSHHQAYPHPVSPDSTEFDDILLENMFKLSTSSLYCLFISPLFWVLITLAIVFAIFLVMNILKCCSKREKPRTILKKTFQHLDLIGEGQLWLGGLVSLAILVFAIFAGKFGILFSRLYPIELINDVLHKDLSCNPTLLNAKFTSSLQLLSTSKHENELPIFNMLDKQPLTLIIDFISTGFTCEKLTVQHKIDRQAWQSSKRFTCNFDNTDSVLSVVNRLSQHRMSTQIQLDGPHFIGGLRLCLQGPSNQIDNKRYYVHQLDFCQFLYTENQTMAIDSTVHIEMTKVVNRTADMHTDDNSSFTALWLPTLTTHLHSDEDEPYHYMNLRRTLVVDISESKFFMKNTQEPIARPYEIIFNTILFSSKSPSSC